ncbi:MAG: hypothetical protein GY792_27805 [Gammaproteobacteria bacterium]|nr:hypothetical protein [Gammaproteobacteria bacterium]
MFQLGPVTDHGQWHDYLQYGFGTADVPELLSLVSDESLHKSDSNGNEVWVPLHAWRALGQLRSPLAVAPLIVLFEFLWEDDWAISELGIVLGMIGVPAIESLSVCLKDSCHAEIARIMALDGLAEVAKQYPECRDRIIEIIRGYMVCPDTSATGLNGLLLGRLIDLEAVELVDDIRCLFDMECVDISCAGGWKM